MSTPPKSSTPIEVRRRLKTAAECLPDGERGIRRVFDPSLLSAELLQEHVLCNPEVPDGCDVSAQIFVCTSGSGHAADYEAADVFYVPPGSALLKKGTVLGQPFKSGWYVETKPGKRFAVVTEHHAGKDPVNVRVSLEGDERSSAYTTVCSGDRCAKLGFQMHCSTEIEPFVFEAIDAEEGEHASSSGAKPAADEREGVLKVEVFSTYYSESERVKPGKCKAPPPKAAAASLPARKKAKTLGGIAGTQDRSEHIGWTSSGYCSRDHLRTLSIHYRSQLFMMVAGMRPDLVRPVEDDDAVVEVAPRPRRRRREVIGAPAGPRAPLPPRTAGRSARRLTGGRPALLPPLGALHEERAGTWSWT